MNEYISKLLTFKIFDPVMVWELAIFHFNKYRIDCINSESLFFVSYFRVIKYLKEMFAITVNYLLVKLYY